ncbi:MAG TPA: DNA translocase FtsK, partial [Vicinamibacteria bacterium]|nr:DNA translocase FtsK [Vicinamibacteria bacterium]
MASDGRTSTRRAELLGLFAFAMALMLLISLATFNPGDPAPFFKAGSSGPARNFIGPFGAFLAELLVAQLFGVAALLIPLVLGLFGWKLFWCKPIEAPYTKAFGIGLLLLSLTAFLTLTFASVAFEGEIVRAGGATGQLMAGLLIADFGRTGAYIVVATSLFVSLILSTQFSFASFLQGGLGRIAVRVRAWRTAWAHWQETRRKDRMRREVIRKHTQNRETAGESLPRVRKVRSGAGADEDDAEPLGPVELGEEDDVALVKAPRKAPAQKPLPFSLASEGDDDEEASDATPVSETKVATALKRRVQKLRPGTDAVTGGEVRGNYTLPPTSLLDELAPDINLDKTRLFERAKTLQSKAAEFGVLGSVVEIHPGPVVTTYEFKPDAGIKYSKIVGLADDLALALEAESIRIDRMSGRGTVGIEIPNEVRETISLRQMLESDGFSKSSGRLTMVLGKTVGGEPFVTDLAAMPHLLIAGSTGTGKSVGLNCMIASILFRSTPDEVRMVLIDPKRLELGVYEDIPHLLTPVVTDPKIASNVLKWAVTEMEKRIRRLASEGVRNIEQFNNIIRAEKEERKDEDGEALKPLHYIVIIIDELADLMMVSSHEVEEAITRLAQMARAVGIHLILATQRPSVDVLTGLIKANFPSRISFRVAARVDSRTILDSIGAEHLLGKGDMLFLPPGTSRLIRVHGAFVTEPEINRVVDYWKAQARP